MTSISRTASLQRCRVILSRNFSSMRRMRLFMERSGFLCGSTRGARDCPHPTSVLNPTRERAYVAVLRACRSHARPLALPMMWTDLRPCPSLGPSTVWCRTTLPSKQADTGPHPVGAQCSRRRDFRRCVDPRPSRWDQHCPHFCDHGHSRFPDRTLALRPHVDRNTESLFERIPGQPTDTPAGTARTSPARGFVPGCAERLRR
jgi:hypothetical protein